jgi:hypothetical protein
VAARDSVDPSALGRAPLPLPLSHEDASAHADPVGDPGQSPGVGTEHAHQPIGGFTLGTSRLEPFPDMRGEELLQVGAHLGRLASRDRLRSLAPIGGPGKLRSPTRAFQAVHDTRQVEHRDLKRRSLLGVRRLRHCGRRPRDSASCFM